MRRDIGNEVVVAIVAVALLAFALTAAVLLSLSTSNQNVEVTSTFVGSNADNETETQEIDSGTRTILEAVTEDAAKTLTQAFLQLTVLPSESNSAPTVWSITQTKTATIQATEISVVASPTREAVASPAERPTVRPTFTETAAESPTSTQTVTLTSTATDVPTEEPTSTSAPTERPTATDTPTDIPTPSSTFTSTPTERPTQTHTPTAKPTNTDTPLPTSTFTQTASPTATATSTPSRTPTPTATDTPTYTATPTLDFGILPTPTEAQSILVTITATEDLGILPTPSETTTETPESTSTDILGIVPTPTSIPARGDCFLPEGWSIYTVQPDDTLFTIARAVDSTISELTRMNCLEDAALIIAGELLFVPQLPQTPEQTIEPHTARGEYESIGCTDPNTQIIVPVAGDKVRGTFTLLGTASIPNFLYYRIEVRADDEMLYRLYGRYSVAVSRGNLAIIEATELDAGLHWIRLSVVDVNGRIPPQAVCVVPVEVE